MSRLTIFTDQNGYYWLRTDKGDSVHQVDAYGPTLERVRLSDYGIMSGSFGQELPTLTEVWSSAD